MAILSSVRNEFISNDDRAIRCNYGSSFSPNWFALGIRAERRCGQAGGIEEVGSHLVVGPGITHEGGLWNRGAGDQHAVAVDSGLRRLGRPRRGGVGVVRAAEQRRGLSRPERFEAVR